MKCNPWRWLWGLVPILMLSWIAILGERGRIEADLTSRTKTVLERSGYGWANIAFDGRDAVLSGRAIDESEPAKAVLAALDTMGVRSVDNQSGLIEKVDRYEWSAIRKDNRVRLEGLVPSDKARRDVMAMVKSGIPGADIEDRLKLARGAPALDVWLGGIGFGLKQLGQLRDGRIDLEQTSLVVSGVATDARGYRAVKTALSGQMPQGIKLKSEAVRPPLASAYNWSARRDGKELVLAGHVPSDTVREELLRAARQFVPTVKIVDRMEPASGAPEGFAGTAAALVEQLARLEEGTSQLRDKSVTFSGLADTAAHAEDVQAALKRGTLASYKATVDIRHREPLIKSVSPYETAAQSESDVIVLTGYVPDDKARAAVISMAKQRFAGRRVQDELQLGAGQPPGWEQCVEAGIDALQSLGKGRASLSDRRLLVSGSTDVEAVAQSLPGDVKSRAGSSCDADVRVTLDVNALQAKEEARRRAEDEVRKAEAERRSQEEVRLAAERRQAEEAARQQQASLAERQRSEDERRRAEQAARLKAEEDSRRAEAERARAAARAPVVPERTPQQKIVDACQEAMSKVAREGMINFKRANFDLDPTSFPTLNRVAEAANRCPDVVVEIEGHTDSEGTPERNQRLSDRRANSVRDYLARAGVDPARLVAIGYGQERNIAPNETPEGRAKNRRIEFTVKMR